MIDYIKPSYTQYPLFHPEKNEHGLSLRALSSGVYCCRACLYNDYSMLRSFFLSKEWALWAWGGLFFLFATIIAEVQMQVKLNTWYRNTWDLLGAAAGFSDPKQQGLDGLTQFWAYILEFCVIAFPLILLLVVSSFVAQHYAFRWRQAMTFAYFPLWQQATQDIEGASQRLQQDPERFARIVERLGLGLFRAVLTLIAFIPILWSLSAELTKTVNDKKSVFNETFTDLTDAEQSLLDNSLWGLDFVTGVEGSLMWVAILSALLGIGVSYLVGIKLPGLEYNNQRVEARFRKRLVYGEDDKDYADIPSLVELFTGLRLNYFRLYLHYSYFSLWQNFFFQSLIIVDFVLIGPGILVGLVTLGVLNQVSHAFGKVSDSMNYLVSHWTEITELLSIIKRLKEFEANIGYSGAASQSTETVQKL